MRAPLSSETFGGNGPEDEAAGTTDPATPAERAETLRERLERQVRELGYALVRADHLVQESPTVVVTELIADQVRVGELENHEDDNLKELMQCEFEFHNRVYEATHNPKLIGVLHELQGVSARFWHYQIFSKQELLDQFIDHRKALHALRKREGERAGEILTSHIQKVLKKLGDKVLK